MNKNEKIINVTENNVQPLNIAWQPLRNFSENNFLGIKYQTFVTKKFHDRKALGKKSGTILKLYFRHRRKVPIIEKKVLFKNKCIILGHNYQADNAPKKI